MSDSLKRHLATWAPIVGSGLFAAVLSARLYTYHVPVLLLTACGLALWVSLLSTFSRITEAAQTTTYRCTAPGCDFTVRLRHTDAAESRSWQEAVASHPAHRL